MSRSYRHFPCCKDGSSRRGKTYASRRYRRCTKTDKYYTGKGNYYRRFTDSWEICDYRFKHSFPAYLKRVKRFNRISSDIEEEYQYWLKYYIRK